MTGKAIVKTGVLALWALLAAAPALAQPARIKDIADIEGVRDNQLVGYGLVVGLAGTGDRLRTAIFTRQSLVGMLERLGVNTRDNEARLDTRNIAAVMVTANLPAFSRPGSRIDIAVSALGDATNLMGGTLLVTPLLMLFISLAARRWGTRVGGLLSGLPITSALVMLFLGLEQGTAPVFQCFILALHRFPPKSGSVAEFRTARRVCGPERGWATSG